MDDRDRIIKNGSKEVQAKLANAVERAYLNKEIERMYERLAKSGRDTAMVSYKLSALKHQSHRNAGDQT